MHALRHAAIMAVGGAAQPLLARRLDGACASRGVTPVQRLKARRRRCGGCINRASTRLRVVLDFSSFASNASACGAQDAKHVAALQLYAMGAQAHVHAHVVPGWVEYDRAAPDLGIAGAVGAGDVDLEDVLARQEAPSDPTIMRVKVDSGERAPNPCRPLRRLRVSAAALRLAELADWAPALAPRAAARRAPLHRRRRRLDCRRRRSGRCASRRR